MAPDDAGHSEFPTKGEPMKGRPRAPRATFKTSFLTGLVIAAPIGITIFLAWSFISFVDNQVRPIVLKITPTNWHEFINEYAAIPGLGLLLIVVTLTLLGMLTANIAGRTIVGWGDGLVHRMPVIGTIYKTLKQIFETIIAQADPTFQEACLIEYPRRDTWAIAFITANTKGEIQAKSEEDLVTVFLPTTPNPTSGFLLFLPKKDIRVLDMSVEEAAKLVISAGIVTPDYKASADSSGEDKDTTPKSNSQSFIERFTKKKKLAS